ncbi:MAG: phosphopyruvate hydratase [Gemmatales bacterium]|nr:phosphopyruvate hydratase [Gemmatales bacterium]MDW8222044.1 phosphopyruvate hydratase [Gemmatales bacterium]
MNVTIRELRAREILDSRGNPTVEVEVCLSDGTRARAAVPSGASTGKHEVLELRDTAQRERYHGRGVRQAVRHVNEIIAPALCGQSPFDQLQIDGQLHRLDGSENLSRLGANAVLGVSLAVAHAAARHLGLGLWRYLGGPYAHTLPVPLMNVINGGAHADNNLDIQEFMLVPAGAPNFTEGLRMGVEVFHTLKRLLKESGLSTAVGDEGGFAPDLPDDEKALEFLARAVEKSGYRLGEHVWLALDAAATEMYEAAQQRHGRSHAYCLFKSNPDQVRSTDDMIRYWERLCANWPALCSLEDPLAEDDWSGWQALTQALGQRVQIVGDDLFVTNPKRLRQGILHQSANAILVKVNQIGTLSDTLATIELAKRHRFGILISHRSGETEDTTIADLAVATNAGQIKTGAPSRTDRTCKYNQLLRIEEALGSAARYGIEGWPPRR